MMVAMISSTTVMMSSTIVMKSSTTVVMITPTVMMSSTTVVMSSTTVTITIAIAPKLNTKIMSAVVAASGWGVLSPLISGK